MMIDLDTQMYAHVVKVLKYLNVWLLYLLILRSPISGPTLAQMLCFISQPEKKAKKSLKKFHFPTFDTFRSDFA